MTLRTIIIIEDDPAHARIVERMLSRLGLQNPLLRCASGNEALQLLESLAKDNSTNFASQYVLLIDINLPGLNGFQVMEKLDSNSVLRFIPRIIISTSDEPLDISRSKDFAHLAYLIKPLDYARIVELIKELDA
ncbi:MAG: response regulator [Chloroflexota bacterium]|nr:response regulator [Chloroflexota bacterium]